MPNKLGKVVSQGCYKGDSWKSDAKFLHNCIKSQGDNVQWKFEVLDQNNQLVGHVIASLSRSFKGNESQQKARILKIARSKIN